MIKPSDVVEADKRSTFWVIVGVVWIPIYWILYILVLPLFDPFTVVQLAILVGLIGVQTVVSGMVIYTMVCWFIISHRYKKQQEALDNQPKGL